MTRLPRPLLWVMLLGACSAPTSAPPSSRDVVEAELVAARDRVWRAFFEGDSAGLVAALPDSMIGMGESVTELLQQSREFRQGGGRLVDVHFRDTEFAISREMALVVSNFRVDFTEHDTARVMEGRAIELFTRDGGRWVNPFWHLETRAADSTSH